jgi:hypothetical protein
LFCTWFSDWVSASSPLLDSPDALAFASEVVRVSELEATVTAPAVRLRASSAIVVEMT